MERFFGEIEGAGFEIIEEEFNGCLTGHGRVERLWTGARWVEGPVWFPAGRFLLFSDIPNNRMLRWDETMLVYQIFEILPISQTEILEIFRDV